jgi:glutamyl-tRNA reductase
MEEVAKFLAWQSTLGVVPTVVSLRTRFEEVAGAELKKTIDSMPELGEREKKALELLAHNIVIKLLHEPTTMLKRCAESGDGEAAKACQMLFKLQVESEEEEETSENLDEETDG